MNYEFSALPSFLKQYGRTHKGELMLFRGQDCPDPLLPKIARKDPRVDTTKMEKAMLSELRRVGSGFLPQPEEDDWDLLARAQHYGMSTRLLDWTSNPLAAVWFACRDRDIKKSGFVYSIDPDDNQVLTKSTEKGPFDTGYTVVYRPRLNSPRIVAQAGWFTLHRFSNTARRFVPLNSNPNTKEKIDKWEVPGASKERLLNELDQLGINYQSMFPDLEGVCRHLNWVNNTDDIKANKAPDPTTTSVTDPAAQEPRRP